jgi:hypothetical protein
MPIPTYTQGYPPDGSSLGQTKSTIRNNLDGTFQTLAVDHVNNNGQPGSNPAGYHTVIHEVTQTSVSTISGVNQIFSGVPGTLVVNAVTTPAIPSNGDTQLYSLTGTGVLSQLTGSSSATNGYQWIGGLLLQWGTTSGTSSSTLPVSFSPAFPNNCFNVNAIPIRAASSPGSDFATCIVTSSVSKTGFTIGNIGSHTVSGYYWFAIGN